MLQHTLLLLLWATFGLLHSLLAADRVKEKIARWWGTGFIYYRLVYSVLAFIQLGLIGWYQFSITSPVLWLTPAFIQVVLVFTSLTGLVLMCVMIRKYFFHLSGIDVFFTTNHSAPFLVTTGLHSKMRHPLYTGTLLFLWSLCLLFPRAAHLLSVATITLYTIIGARLEEAKLAKTFGAAYSLYKKQVPMLIPSLRFKK